MFRSACGCWVWPLVWHELADSSKRSRDTAEAPLETQNAASEDLGAAIAVPRSLLVRRRQGSQA